MSQRDGADKWIRSIPDAMQIVCHEVKPVYHSIEVHDVEIPHIPIRRRAVQKIIRLAAEAAAASAA